MVTGSCKEHSVGEIFGEFVFVVFVIFLLVTGRCKEHSVGELFGEGNFGLILRVVLYFTVHGTFVARAGQFGHRQIRES